MLGAGVSSCLIWGSGGILHFAVAARGNMKQRRRTKVSGPREEGITTRGKRNGRWLGFS